jgi:hypothetical protein
MRREEALRLLSERHKVNRERIRAYTKYENLDGTVISKGHAATALSNARKEQLVVELLLETVAVGPAEYNWSERAQDGFYRLVEPLERHFAYQKETKTFERNDDV